MTLASRITGNDRGSLGLHPAIYFYGPTGRHSSAMFLGMVSLFSEKLSNNNKDYFNRFTEVRHQLEDLLITNKELIAAILQKHISHKRISVFKELIAGLVSKFEKGDGASPEEIIELAQLDGKLITGDALSVSSKISDDQKSKLFINVALKCAVTCNICGGYLDVDKSDSYDHKKRVREGGGGSADNVQLTHPYCNQSVKQ